MSTDHPFTEERPWGQFRQLTPSGTTEPTTVKVIFIRKGQRLSLQYHHKRSEFWRVLSGSPRISLAAVAEDGTVGDVRVTEAKGGDEFAVLPETAHRISAPDGDVEVLEIATGAFDEQGDIVRVEDDYGRVS